MAAAARVVRGAVLAILFLAAPGALGQESAKDYIEPRVSRPQFLLLYRQLGLDSNQRSIAELMYSDYSGALDDLMKQMDAQAEQAGARTVQDAMLGKVRLSAEELRAKRVAVLKAFEQHFAAIDKALDHLLGGLESILTPEQEIHFQPALRELNRSIYLHPRQNGAGFQEYAGDGVDVLMMVDDAMKEGGELHGLEREALASILGEYEHQLDALLVRTTPEHRDLKIRRKIAGIEKDSAAMRDLDQMALARWKELYQFNLTTVKRIGEVAGTTLGEAARQKWLDRFDQASFTWLYPRKKPDRQIEWIRQQSLPAETRERAEDIYEEYLSKRRELSRQAIDIMLRARIEFQTMLYSMMDPATVDGTPGRPLYDQLLRNTGEQANLDNTTSTALEELLNAQQRESMRKATQGPEPTRRR